MIKSIINPNENDVNPKSEQGTKVLAELKALASVANKIKLHEGYTRCSARFFNGSVTPVPSIEADDYEALVSHLRATGWQLERGLENGAYVARKVTQ